MELPILFYKTVLLRPYVFVFLIVFLFASIVQIGRNRTLVFLGVTWLITFLCEYSSTRNGFPFGLYHYTGTTRGQELFFSNVPFFDSLSFTFLLFASYSMSLLTFSPIRVEKKNIRVLDTFEIRQSKRVLILTALYMMMIDVVIDPVALRGDQWFLGKIYYYEHPGFFFGIPLTNAVGWAVVGFVSLWIYQIIEKKYFSKPILKKCDIPYQSLMGVGLYYGVLLFMLSICIWIDEPFLLIASAYIFLLPTATLIFHCRDPKSRATQEEWKKHCENFPIT